MPPALKPRTMFVTGIALIVLYLIIAFSYEQLITVYDYSAASHFLSLGYVMSVLSYLLLPFGVGFVIASFVLAAIAKPPKD